MLGYNFGIGLDPNFQITAILLLGVIGIVVIGRLLVQPDKKRLFVRIVLSVLAWLALAGVALRPFYYETEGTMDAVLLTDQYNPEAIEKLRFNKNTHQVFSLLPKPDRSDVLQVADIEALYEAYPQIDSLHILGNGLPEHMINQLEGRKFAFHLNDVPEGIIKFTYPKTVREASSIPIAGIYNHKDTSEVVLELKSPYGYTTLLKTNKPGQHIFKTQITAKQSGRYLFNLIKNAQPDDVQQDHQFPLIILPKKRYSALIINHVPNFEFKYLKNWLADQGYEVSVRTAISKYRYKTEFLNRPAVNLDQLKASVLNRFDVLILSGNTLLNLKPAERSAIQTAVKKGLGLCLSANDELINSNFKERSFFLPFTLQASNDAITLPAKWKGLEEVFELPASGFEIKDQYGVFPLLTDLKNENRVAFTRQSLGRMALNLIQQTYLLSLQGKEEAYSAIWSEVLENVIRQDFVRNDWTVQNELVSHPHQQLNIELLSDENLPKGVIETPTGRQTAFYFQQALEDNENGVVTSGRPIMAGTKYEP